MRTALIPPVAHLQEFCGQDRFHLVLSHMLENTTYRKFYQMQRLLGSYLILDNGAHENTSGEAMSDLLRKAGDIRASEMVLPDTLFDHRATVRGTEDALIYLMGPGGDFWGGKSHPRMMLVPQGKTWKEWERCFQDLVSAYVKAQVQLPSLFPRFPVFGISKDYEVLDGGIPRILEYLEPFRDWMTFDVHLLGWGRKLWVLAELARRFPWVRSTDSAKPFVYATAGILLHPDRPAPEYPTRPPDYFSCELTPDELSVARYNVEMFRGVAG